MKNFLVMIYIQVHVFESEEIKKGFNIQMENIYFAQINEHMHDSVICQQVIFITNRMY